MGKTIEDIQPGFYQSPLHFCRHIILYYAGENDGRKLILYHQDGSPSHMKLDSLFMENAIRLNDSEVEKIRKESLQFADWINKNSKQSQPKGTEKLDGQRTRPPGSAGMNYFDTGDCYLPIIKSPTERKD